MISPVTILTKRGKGRPGYSWCVTKSETIKNRNFCRKSSFTRATRLAAPKMVNFCAKTKRNIHVWNSLPYPTEFFNPTFKFIDWFLKNKFEPSTNGDSVV